jgi:uncharacterized membrane protein (UPF0182 family)
MAETLDAGLSLLFGGSSGRPAVVSDSTTAPAAASSVDATLLRQVRDAYDRAIAAQRAGNWAQYGEEMNRLGELLRRLARTP